MFDWCETMQHKAMHDIFRKGQRNKVDRSGRFGDAG
jgi:hypothetical protein